ncbi:unnamed protein product [Cuscuta epithymum]|uniref:Uncharacterized protein n=1 Tax=Cuscuta epithymum TaxID=186058 RepID=A0AAV0GAL7_9ASTE|nr:unnamed protein product [Cuscuta epithymum]
MEGRRMRTRNNPRGQAPVTSQRGSRAASRGSRGGRGGRGSRGGHQAQTVSDGHVEARACYLHLSTGDIKSRKTCANEPRLKKAKSRYVYGVKKKAGEQNDRHMLLGF